MNPEPDNPYPPDSASAALWEVCVLRDIRSFAEADWSICAGDFSEESFAGWNARFSPDPLLWQMSFPTLGEYKLAWLRDAHEFSERQWHTPLATSLFSALTLARIEIAGDNALVHKRFDGKLLPVGADPISLSWQSIFHLSRQDGRWLQRGFVGYLPL
jgi:hypothetical protein